MYEETSQIPPSPAGSVPEVFVTFLKMNFWLDTVPHRQYPDRCSHCNRARWFYASRGVARVHDPSRHLVCRRKYHERDTALGAGTEATLDFVIRSKLNSFFQMDDLFNVRVKFTFDFW
jgi:hypothetical protein